MKKIMVVDDQAGIRMLLSEILTREGYEVYTCANGPEVLALLREHDLSFAILDMKIPGMGGLEILHQIREIKPDLKVVVITAYSEHIAIREAEELGVIDIFSKPFDIDDILHAVNQEIGELAR